jgi:tRNA-intron endonuclease
VHDNVVNQKVTDLNQPKQTKTSSSNEVKVIKASLKDSEIVVSASQDIEELATRGYGTKKNKTLTLTFYETLFLLSKQIIKVEQQKTKKQIDFQQLLDDYKSTDPNAWAKYLIYRDLRSRGYVAREGFGLGTDFRVYERGEYGAATAKYLIYGIQEGQPVSIEELAQALRYAHSQKKELVLAVLNRRGEVVYYSLGQLTLKRKPTEL